jgi:hypothetical protein
LMVFAGSSPITTTSPSSKAHQKSGPFPHPLARDIAVGALARLLKGGADVRDSLKSKGTPGASHLVSQTRYDLRVDPIGRRNLPQPLRRASSMERSPEDCPILMRT